MTPEQVRTIVREELVAVLKELSGRSATWWEPDYDTTTPPDMQDVFMNVATELERKLT